ncbi:PTS transporter subunit EIIB [Bacillus sp. N9]
MSAGTHCATRLRLVLHDEDKVDQSQMDQMDVVKGTFSTGGQFKLLSAQGR